MVDVRMIDTSDFDSFEIVMKLNNTVENYEKRERVTLIC